MALVLALACWAALGFDSRALGGAGAFVRFVGALRRVRHGNGPAGICAMPMCVWRSARWRFVRARIRMALARRFHFIPLRAAHGHSPGLLMVIAQRTLALRRPLNKCSLMQGPTHCNVVRYMNT